MRRAVVAVHETVGVEAPRDHRPMVPTASGTVGAGAVGCGLGRPTRVGPTARFGRSAILGSSSRYGDDIGVICSSCGTENLAGARFCMECATPFAAVCPSCGASQPAGRQVLLRVRDADGRRRAPPRRDGPGQADRATDPAPAEAVPPSGAS